MPQVYWEQSHNSESQLARSVQEFNNASLVGHIRPIVPTGSAYGSGGWEATADDVRRFMQKAKDLGLAAANAYSWDWATSSGKSALFDSVAGFNWHVDLAPSGGDSSGVTATPSNDIVDQYFEALNRFDVDQLIQLYQPNAIHVTAQRTLSGREAIKNFYTNLLGADLPYPRFHFSSVTNQDPTRIFTWDRRK